MMSFDGGTAYAESDADDEYERSMGGHSPIGDSEASPIDSELSTSAEHTPTTYGHRNSTGGLPDTVITDWMAEDCADFITAIGLQQYADIFLENDIVGEALVALLHDDLKSMGIASVGHRLTILKSVYDVKKAQDIPMESDHYLPLSADAEAQYTTATIRDIKHLVEQLRLRDERMSLLEQDLRRMTEDFRRLREDVLPALRLAKDAQHPLPNVGGSTPTYGYDGGSMLPPGPTPPGAQPGDRSGVKRQYSQRRILIGATPKSSSPTQATHDRLMVEAALDPERTLMSSTHLSAMNGGVVGGGGAGVGVSGSGAGGVGGGGGGGSGQGAIGSGYPSPVIPSPTSPQPNYLSGTTLASRSYRADAATPSGRSTFAEAEHAAYASNRDKLSATPSVIRRRETPAPDNPTPSSSGGLGSSSGGGIGSSSGSGGGGSGGSGGGGGSGSGSGGGTNLGSLGASTGTGAGSSHNNSSSSVEIFKSFRVSMDDPCYKVLPAALKKYQINAPWDQYALYIVYGDQERCLGMDEKPLILFKQLDKEGKKPMFMLRKTNGAGGEGGDGVAGVGGRAYDPPGGII